MPGRSSHADPPSPLAANLKAALAAHGMTQEALAREIGVSLSAVTAWCGGDALPRWKSLVAIAVILQRDPSWFYAEHDTVPAS